SADGLPPFDLLPPEFSFVREGDQTIAFIWYCMNKARASVDEKRMPKKATMTLVPRYAGLVFKMKCVSIGTRDKPRELFRTRPQVYPWFTGEIYVLAPRVVPNAERNDFEASPA